MTVSSPQVAKPDSAVKRTLDHLELVEKVPALTRASGRTLPRHPAVIAYVNECATVKRPDVGLRVARQNFKLASVNFENRCAFRSQRDIEWRDGGKFVSLSAIIEARADALYWRKMVLKLEAAKKMKEQQEQNRRSINRHRLRSMGLTA